MLVIQASAPMLNPTLPPDYLARMEEDDPEAYRSEVLGEFRAGVSTLLDPAAIEACVDTGVRERPPAEGLKYFGFVDVASGTDGRDRFTLGVAHLADDRAVLDCLRVWKPPFNPNAVIAETADVLRTYRLRQVTGDLYAPGFVKDGFATNRITYLPSRTPPPQDIRRDKSMIYLELVPLINSGRAVLLDVPEALRELRGLDRRRGFGGRDKVDVQGGRGHDDQANVIAGALVLAAESKRVGKSGFVVTSATRSFTPDMEERKVMSSSVVAHPHELAARLTVEADERLGVDKATRWRHAWGGTMA
ncbi:MAG: hypothetical protein HY615_07680 [Candidatus Rokubacteria bacterium]|nr:hypothetical protein [Candidatus Rokubacteria bacterium]